MKRSIVVALLAAALAVAGAAGGARASARAACGVATSLKGAPILQLGPVRIAGFSSAHCAWLSLGCGPKAGGYQAALSLELSEPPAKPIVLRAGPAEAVTFVLVGSRTPAPKVPHCLSTPGTQAKATLRAPRQYFVLFVFAAKNVDVHLTASRGARRLAAAVISVRR